jgi:hypothetical protein
MKTIPHAIVVEGAITKETSSVRRAREHAHNLVHKPQREGGGHNVFKEDFPAYEGKGVA